MWNQWISIAVALLLAAVVTAPAAAQGQKPWRHGILEAKSDAGFVMMVSRRGFAEKQGIKLEILQVKSDQVALKALLAGELESYEGGPGGAIVAGARGGDIKFLGCHWPGLVHGIFVRSNVAKLEDLKGKNFAISSPGALPDLLARAALEKYSVPASEIKFANLGSDLDRYKALTAGVVDAAVVSTEYLPIAPKDIKLLASGRELLPNFMRVCVISSGKVLQERREDAVHFVAAEIQALRYAVSHREEALKLTQEVTNGKADDPRPAFIFDEVVRHKDIDPELGIPMAKLEWMQGMQIKAGNLPQPTDLAKLIDAGVRAKALDLIGK
jgi:NitT/TauT family transport system substrate-binding protein